jgi:transposase
LIPVLKCTVSLHATFRDGDSSKESLWASFLLKSTTLSIYMGGDSGYRSVSNPSMRMGHKAGDRLLIDCTGDRLWICSPVESPRQAGVFVAVTGFRLFTYAEAAGSQSKEAFITSCANAVYYYGGVPPPRGGPG